MTRDTDDRDEVVQRASTDSPRYEVRVGAEEQVETYPDDLPVRHRTEDLGEARREAMRRGRAEDLPAGVWDTEQNDWAGDRS